MLILSHQIFNERSGTVIAVAVTSVPQKAGLPLVLQVPEGILPKASWVKISQIRTLSVSRLRGRIGAGPPELLITVLEGLEEIIGP